MTPEALVRRWSGREGGAERANYALFLTELTQALDLPPPEPADSASTYRFEYPVEGDWGQPLRIDLYKQGCFVLEAKQSRWAGNPHVRAPKNEAPVQPDMFGAGLGELRARVRRTRWDADLRAAFSQARDYATRLPAQVDRPPFLITCDVGATFEFYSDFTGQGRAYRPFTHRPSGRRLILLEDLLDKDVQDLFRRVWTEPRTLDPAVERSRATREVAGHLAEVSRTLEGRGHAPEEVAAFLGRLLFAMFAEDVGLLPPESLSDLLRACLDSPASFMPLATALFARMDEGFNDPLTGVSLRRFNGAFYKDRRAFPLARKEIGALLEAARADWREVDPAIFGTLLEQALDPAERGRLGAHYTPRPYVERLVQATVMGPLRTDWDAARAAAEARHAAGDAAGARRELLTFHDQLTRTRVLDPACGTGNFLYVALELMKGLESEVLEARAALAAERSEAHEGLVSGGFERGVDPRRFLGLELNPRAAAIAELVLWIGYLQASYRRDPEYNARTPVLEAYGNINPPESRGRRGHPSVDAVLRHDGDILGGGGTAYPNPRRPAWPEAEFIVGNPPFIGGKDLRAELGDAYAEALWRAHPGMNDSADLVMYWWDHAADLLTRKGSALRRFGLVTTNSVTQVFQRRTLARWLGADNPNKRPLSLVFAVADHPWTKAGKDAAAVRIAMTAAEAGLHEGELLTVRHEGRLDTDQPELDFVSMQGVIAADLTVGVDVTKAVRLRANEGLCSRGVSLHGAGFILRRTEAERLGLGRRPELGAHVRPYRNGRDLTGRSRDAWVIDLLGLTAEEVRERYPEVYQHLALTIKPDRERNNRATYRENWWIFGEPRRELRPALTGLPRYIATVETAKHRVFQFLDGTVLPDNRLVCFALQGSEHLAVLSSALHLTWTLENGGTLEDRPIYTKSRCFDPFPFPAWSPERRAALAAAGEALEAFRRARLAEHPDLTLTRLYNALEAHRDGRVPAPDRPDSMSPEEARDFRRASVLVLAEHHTEIDRLTLEAYGWTDLAGTADFEQQLLARLVALNAERATEEARGEVRWLRPDYQRPRFAPAQTAGAATAVLELTDAAPIADRLPWPREARHQVLELKEALAEAPAPLPAAQLLARFKGRGAAGDIPRLLGALERSGQIRRSPAGYTLLRAA